MTLKQLREIAEKYGFSEDCELSILWGTREVSVDGVFLLNGKFVLSASATAVIHAIRPGEPS